jgi:transposase
MNIRYRVTLTAEERTQLATLIQGGKAAVRRIKRAQILLAADAGRTDEAIAAGVSVGTATVYRTKRRFVEEGLEQALSEEPRPGAERKLSTTEEAMLVATACTKAPTGRARWTLSLLADEMVRLTNHASISSETVRRRLAENELKPWQKKMWCIPKVDAEFVARMEDVLDLYAEAPDESRPVVCFDETPRQLIGEARVPVAARPGKTARVDYEYVRNGTANVFMFVDAHRPWRHAKVTDRRANRDFAECMRDLVDLHYPSADCIRVVLDNLSRTSRPPSMRPSLPKRRDASYGGWNSTTRRSTRAGSTWSRSRSASWSRSASTAAYPIRRRSSPKSCSGSAAETLNGRESTGSSPSTPRA